MGATASELKDARAFNVNLTRPTGVCVWLSGQSTVSLAVSAPKPLPRFMCLQLEIALQAMWTIGL